MSAAALPDFSNEAPLVRRLSQLGASWVTQASHEAFIAQGGEQVLFFSGDPVRFAEVLDVAVVLPELQKAFDGRFAMGVVCRADEEALARRWGVQRWPSLVFVRDGLYLGCISSMLDWSDYLERVAAVLAQPGGRAPISVLAAGAAPACH
jgi:hydrogenase-1 operon protein HyaE